VLVILYDDTGQAAWSPYGTVGPDTTSGNESAAAAADYCAENGGTVDTRQPYWNTNADRSTWVQLPGRGELSREPQRLRLVRQRRGQRRGLGESRGRAVHRGPSLRFPDGSAIDAWGIAYYSDGVARGIDLTEVFRFDQDAVPDIFPE
jgi:hypothetical protein